MSEVLISTPKQLHVALQEFALTLDKEGLYHAQQIDYIGISRKFGSKYGAGRNELEFGAERFRGVGLRILKHAYTFTESSTITFDEPPQEVTKLLDEPVDIYGLSWQRDTRTKKYEYDYHAGVITSRHSRVFGVGDYEYFETKVELIDGVVVLGGGEGTVPIPYHQYVAHNDHGLSVDEFRLDNSVQQTDLHSIFEDNSKPHEVVAERISNMLQLVDILQIS